MSTLKPELPLAGRRFYGAMLTISLAIGALQMYRVHGGWITSYGADVFGTAWLYAMIRQGRTIFRRGVIVADWHTALFVFAGCAASECGQQYHLVPGRFDWYDLLAYGLTVLACVAIDRRLALA